LNKKFINKILKAVSLSGAAFFFWSGKSLTLQQVSKVNGSK